MNHAAAFHQDGTARAERSPVSVILPAYREQEAIAEVIANVREVLRAAGIEHEIVVVDDGSEDNTSERASAADRVIRHPHNLGYGRSLKSGIHAARYDRIAILDADGSYPAEQLPRMLEMSESCHMVVGARSGKIYQGGIAKRLGRLVFRALVEFATGQSVPDINSGMRIFRRGHVVPLFPMISSGFSFTTTITLLYLLNDLIVVHVPIEYHRRRGKSKVHHVRDALRALQIIVEAILRCNPIKIFLLLSAPFVLAGFALTVTALVLQSLGWLIASLIAFGFAFVLFALGCLAVTVMPLRRNIDPL